MQIARISFSVVAIIGLFGSLCDLQVVPAEAAKPAAPAAAPKAAAPAAKSPPVFELRDRKWVVV
jgi:hypothetical protein